MNAPPAVNVLADPTLTMPALANAPGDVKLRPLRIVKLPAAVLVAKAARASAPLRFWIAEPTPSKRIAAALVTMLAPLNCRMPGPVML